MRALSDRSLSTLSEKSDTLPKPGAPAGGSEPKRSAAKVSAAGTSKPKMLGCVAKPASVQCHVLYLRVRV